MRRQERPVGIPSGWEYLAAFYWDNDLWPISRRRLIVNHLDNGGGVYFLSLCDFSEVPDVPTH